MADPNEIREWLHEARQAMQLLMVGDAAGLNAIAAKRYQADGVEVEITPEGLQKWIEYLERLLGASDGGWLWQNRVDF